MLKSPKKAELAETPPSHVDLFVDNYDQLKSWALQFSEYDHESAEDLLHDFFLHLTFSKPDFASIQNLDGYLYVVMRNLHLSQVRRATRMPQRSLSAVEFDTVDVGLWASDPRDRMKMRDELGAVCHYACMRKESSKAGSVLILRFFHGYYPDEIARIMCVKRPAVKERLRLARAEAKLYLSDPDRLSFIGDKPNKLAKFAVDPAISDLRNQLRGAIFSSCHGEHLSESTQNQLYRGGDARGPECNELAHIASCAKCLDEINTLLEIPTLAGRYPEDTVGKDPGDKRGGGSSGGSGAGGGSRKMLDSYIRRSNDLFYHEPQELCVAVNGHLQGLQRVASDKNEMTLILDTTENLGFVEVFSEQGIRLLMLNVERPPDGDAKQSTRVELSDGRTLDANLNFSGSFPALQVTYQDPSLALDAIEITETPSAASESVLSAVADGTVTTSNEEVAEVAESKAYPLSKEGWTTLRRTGWLSRFDLRSWLQPARVTAAFAVLLIAALVFIKFGPVATVSAAELLTRSAAAEDARLANRDRVLHRTLDFVESDANGQIRSRKKIDVWQSAEKGITARRIYDDQGRLTIGDWRSTNGVQTIYARGAQARLQPLPESRIRSIGFDDAWQLSVSSKEFSALLASNDQATVTTRDNNYLIAVSVPPATEGGTVSGVTRAAIVLSKEDLHAVEQTFTLRYGDETRDYRITEASYEFRPSNTVPPAVFEPNVELTGGTAVKQPETRALSSVADLSVPPSVAGADFSNTNTQPANAAMAMPALEVEVIDALNGVNAFMGEQVTVQRDAGNRLQVSALVETDKRKAELLAALARFKTNPAVRINIETVAEAQAREARTKKGNQTQGDVSMTSVEAVENTSPVYNDLRKKFSETETRAFADRVLSRSSQARRHALAAKQLSDRFSQTDLAGLTPAERELWLGLIRGHASQFLAETEALRRELEQVFPDLGGGGAGGGVASDREIQNSVRQLFDLAVACDEDLRGSFALLTNANSAAEVKTAKFWRALNNATAIARSLQGAK
jgi:RNA polymerase sigma factor (sigma-70 family)